MADIENSNVITTLRPSPAKGEGIGRNVKDRTATERKRRSRANKRKRRDIPVTMPGHGVTVPVTAPVTVTAGSIGRSVAAGLLGAHRPAVKRIFVRDNHVLGSSAVLDSVGAAHLDGALDRL